MILTYENYLKLQEALRKHYEEGGTPVPEEPFIIQNQVFEHFIKKFGSFVAVNSNGTKMLFQKNNKQGRRDFRKFMNPEKYEEDAYHYRYAKLSSKHGRTNNRASRKRTKKTKDSTLQDSTGTSKT